MANQLADDFAVRRPLLEHVANSLRGQIAEGIADANVQAGVVFSVATPEEFAQLAGQSQSSRPLVEIPDQISGRIEASTLDGAQSIEQLVGELVSVVFKKWASDAEAQPPYLTLRCLIPPQAKPDGWSSRTDVPTAFQLLVVVKAAPTLTVFPNEPRLSLPSGDGAPNRALIMKGGGIKGLAYVGAVEVLSKHYDFDWFVGTSAGAITAVFLAADFSTDKMRDILRTKNFRDFFDGRSYALPFNLLVHHGLHPARTFTAWVDTLLAKHLDSADRVKLKQITNATGKRLTVYASRQGEATLKFDSATSDDDAAYAVRCSMSIPLIFFPQQHQGIRTYDGGIRQNYPVEQLLKDSPGTPFIGLFLGSEHYEPVNNRFIIFDLFSIFLEPNDAAMVQEHKHCTVIIDPRPIGTLDFDLTDDEKEFLLACGRAAAYKHLNKDSDEYAQAVLVRDRLKATVETARAVKARRKRYRRIAVVLAVALAAGLYFGRNYVTAFSGWASASISRMLGSEQPPRWQWEQLDAISADKLIPAISRDNAARAVSRRGLTPPTTTVYAFECPAGEFGIPRQLVLRPEMREQFRIALSYGGPEDADPMSDREVKVTRPSGRTILVVFPLDQSADTILRDGGPNAILDHSRSR